MNFVDVRNKKLIDSNVEFILTEAQRKVLENWLGAQSTPFQEDSLTITFNIKPTGVSVKAYAGCLDNSLVQTIGTGQESEVCDLLQAEARDTNPAPIATLGNLQVWLKRPPVTGEPLDDHEIDALDHAINPFLYVTLRDDPQQTRMPVPLASNDVVYPNETRKWHNHIDYDKSNHPLSLYRLWRQMTDDDLLRLDDFLFSHHYALRDYVSGRLPSIESLQTRLDQVCRIPDGQVIPLDETDWHQIENLNLRLMEAERYAREQRMDSLNQHKQLPDEPDWDADFDCELICWLSKDDPDWSEDRDNIVYCNPNISIMADMPLTEDWNTFRVLGYDPMGGRACCYFMHDLIDHGHLKTRDLLRIGDLSLNAHRIVMKEIRFIQNSINPD
jgi:hypothetical protein